MSAERSLAQNNLVPLDIDAESYWREWDYQAYNQDPKRSLVFESEEIVGFTIRHRTNEGGLWGIAVQRIADNEYEFYDATLELSEAGEAVLRLAEAVSDVDIAAVESAA